MKEWEALYDENNDGWFVSDKEGSLVDWDGCCSRYDATLMASAPAILRELQNMISMFQYTDESEGQHEAVQSAKQTLEKYGL